MRFDLPDDLRLPGRTSQRNGFLGSGDGIVESAGGCVGGGGQPYMVTDELRIKRAAALYADDAGKEIRLAHQNPYIMRLYEEFLGKPLSETSKKLLHTEYQPRPVYRK